MNCQRTQQEIKAYIDGELGVVTRFRLSRHLARCAGCRKEMDEMTDLTNQLRNVPGPHAPRGLRDKVMAGIDADSTRTSRPRRLLRTGAAVAAALLGTMLLAAVMFPVFFRAREASRHSEALRNEKMMGAPFGQPAEPGAADSAPQAAPKRAEEGGMGLLVIKTADVYVEVRSFSDANDRAISIAKSVGGYVTDSSAEAVEDTPTSGELTIRVPVDAFERVVEQFGKLGVVKSKAITGEDVTGEVVDLESRIRNKRAEERQYLDIMNRARSITDVVTVSNELYRVRAEIEQAQGRLKYLRSASAMATVNLTLEEKAKMKPAAAGSVIYNSFTGATASLKSTLSVFGVIAVWMVVYSPLWAVPVGIWVYGRRKRVAADARQ